MSSRHAARSEVHALTRVLRWLFIDRTSGRIVVAQRPNLVLWIFLATLAVGAFVPQGTAGTAMHMVGTASLVLWAIDEVLRGVNPWRRLLGGAVLGWLCVPAVLAVTHRG